MRKKKIRYAKDKLTTTWENMVQRCHNPKAPNFKDYGGRGISVCERWRSVRNFREDMGPHPGVRYSLDRIDNEGDYCPENCRWATKSVQTRNTRRNVLITIDGKSKCATDWATANGVPPKTVHNRIQAGWDPVKAVTTPTRQGRSITHDGVTLTIAGWSKRIGIHETAIRYRIASGWPLSKALAGKDHRRSTGLDECAVKLMRKEYAAGKSTTELASQFGCLRDTVWSIVTRGCWKHV